MTPERATYYRLLLSVGLGDEYYRELNQRLEKEDPLSPLTLALASCESSLTETLSVLHTYTLEHPVKKSTVFDWIMDELQAQYEHQHLTQKQIIEIMYTIAKNDDKLFESPWTEFHKLHIDYTILQEGLISSCTFDRRFDAFLYDRKTISVWELEREWYVSIHQPKIRQNLRDSLVLCLTSLFMGCLIALTVVLEIITRGFTDFTTEDWFLLHLFVVLFVIAIILTAHGWKKYRYYKKLLK